MSLPLSPTTAHTFSAGDRTVSYEAIHVTADLNRKLHGVLPAGIYRGFQLAITGTAYTLQAAVSEFGDSVALYDTASGYSITVRKAAAITLVVSSDYDGVDVVVALYATYSTGAATVAEIRLYTVAQYEASADFAQLVVLGTASVPAGGSFAATDLSLYRRTVPADRLPEGQAAARNLLRNPSFERGSVFWKASTSSGSLTVAQGFSGSHKLTGQSAYALLTYGGSAATGSVTQLLDAPVTVGESLAYEVKLKALQASTGGTLALVFAWKDADGDDVTASTVSIALTLDASTRTLAGAVVVPATAARLWQIRLVYTSLTFASSAAAVVVNFVAIRQRVRFGVESPQAEMARGPGVFGELDVVGTTGADAEALARLTFDPSGLPEGLLTIGGRAAADHPGLRALGRLLLGSGLVGSTADALLARLSASARPTAGDLTLVAEIPAAGGQSARVYYRAADAGHTAELRLVVNASADASLVWTKDEAGEAAFGLCLGDGGVVFSERTAGASGTWGDTSWSYTTLSLTGLAAALSGQLSVGGGLPNAYTERVRVESVAATRTGLLLGDAAGSGSVRVYHGTGTPRPLELVVNAAWSGSAWTPDSGTQAYRLVMNHQKARFQYGVGSSVAEGAWVDIALLAYDATDGRRIELADAYLRVTSATAASNPAAATAPKTNTLYASSIAKAWGAVSSDGSGLASCGEGLNVASVGFTGNHLLVTLATPVSTPYAPTVTSLGVLPRIVSVQPVSTTQFLILAWSVDVSTGTLTAINHTAVAADYAFHLDGKQT